MAQTLPLTTQERAFLRTHPVITLGAESAREPFVIVAPDGAVTGFDADILARIRELTGADVRLLPGDRRELHARAARREIAGLVTSAPQAQRLDNLSYTEPFSQTRKLVLVAKGNAHGIICRRDLDGRSIAIDRGNRQDEAIGQGFPRSRIVPMDSPDEIIAALSGGRVDAAFDDGSLLYRANTIASQGLQTAFSLDDTLDLAFGIRKDWPELVAILNKGLAAIPSDERERLRARWFKAVVADSASAVGPILAAPERAFLDRLGPVRVCVEPNWMPMGRLLANGEHEGMLADLLRLLAQRLGHGYTLVPTANWAESLVAVRRGRCDILFGAVDIPERRAYLDFTEPMLVEPLVLVTRHDQDFDDRLERDPGRRYAMVAGHAAIDLIRRAYPAVQIITVPTAAAGLRAVGLGHASGFIDVLPSVSYAAQQERIVDIKVAGTLPDAYPLAIGVRKDLPLLRSSLVEAIGTLTEDEVRLLRERWIQLRYEQPVDYAWLTPWVIATLLLLGAILIWNRRLRQLNAQLQAANHRVAILTITDELTGLHNRRYFNQVIPRELRRSQRAGQLFCFLLADIDHFKEYNDGYGHPAGDQVLAQVGAMFSRYARRGGDYAFRIGGEEFALIFEAAEVPVAVRYADALRRALADLDIPHAHRDGVARVTLSAGLVCVPAGEVTDWQAVYQQADGLLYAAKAAGRNRLLWEDALVAGRPVGPVVGPVVSPVAEPTVDPGAAQAPAR